MGVTNEAKVEKIVRIFKDIDYAVVVTPGAYSVDYVIYEIVGLSHPGEVPVYHGSDPSDEMSTTENIDEASPFAHGSVKWDGCSNWDFDELQRVMLHFCERASLIHLGEILATCWDMTKEFCSKWNP